MPVPKFVTESRTLLPALSTALRQSVERATELEETTKLILKAYDGKEGCVGSSRCDECRRNFDAVIRELRERLGL